MSDTLVLFLPTEHAPYRWLRVADGAVAARGDGLPAIDPAAPGPIGVVPADAVTLHWAELPDRSSAQAVAAARLLAADASVSLPSDLHVAVGQEEANERPIGVVAAARMREWLAELAAEGIDPVALIPAPMLLPRPGEGYLSADLGGDQVVRGPTSGFADDGPFTALVTGGATPTMLDRDEIEAAIVSAIASPALDLRQGAFARRTRVAVDWALVRRLVALGLAILTVSLLISLVQVVRLNLAASGMEARADALARTALSRGESVNDAPRQLDERLARMRGGGIGFTVTAAAVFAALRETPGTDMSGMRFEPNGNLRTTVTGVGEAAIDDLKARIQRAGFTVQASPFQRAGDHVSSELTVSVR